MRITVFGATGPTGRAFIARAAAHGHETVAVVRDPARLLGASPTETNIGSVFDRDLVRRAITGSDAVFVALGARGDRRTRLYSQVTEYIVAAMSEQNVARLVVMSEAAYDRFTTGLLNRVIAAAYTALARPIIEERRRQDAILVSSGLDWTVVRPGVLDDSDSDEPLEPRTTPHRLLPNRTGRVRLADLVLRSLTDPATFRQSLYP